MHVEGGGERERDRERERERESELAIVFNQIDFKFVLEREGAGEQRGEKEGKDGQREKRATMYV